MVKSVWLRLTSFLVSKILRPGEGPGKRIQYVYQFYFSRVHSLKLLKSCDSSIHKSIGQGRS